jgi:hypothetical protein
MSQYMQQIALIEMSITCAVALIYLAQRFSRISFPLVVRIVLLLLLANLFFWPIGLSLELPLSAYVRGVTGELSIVTMLLLWSTLLPQNHRTPLAFTVSVAMLALVFYPPALGYGMFDPYAWGYGTLGLLIALVVFALICGIAGWVKGVWFLSLAIIAWSLHWHESTNLWDYILDPFLAVWAIYAIFHFFYTKRREKLQSGYLFRAG